MSLALIASSMIVGLYGLISLAANFFGTELPPYFLPIQRALGFMAAGGILVGLSLRRVNPRTGAAIVAIASLILLGIGLATAQGYAIISDQSGMQIVSSWHWTDYAPLRAILVPAAALIGLLSLLRRVGWVVLMAGGAILLAVQLFFLMKTPAVATAVAAFISIGFILAGNRQYREESFQY